jgi:hypothetical protein
MRLSTYWRKFESEMRTTRLFFFAYQGKRMTPALCSPLPRRLSPPLEFPPEFAAP